ncbi:MAG TPA: SGNH/GDSL hydrolase family protein [archaeon]|nr:SGNH/GDSL hydrolase family protein [archaeon]
MRRRHAHRVLLAAVVIAAAAVAALGWQPAESCAGDCVRYVAIGDSYTIGQGVPEAERWPDLLAAALNEKGYAVELVANPSVTGWTAADALEREVPVLAEAGAEFVTVQIGVNDWVQGVPAPAFRERFAKLLDAIRKELPDPQNVLVVTVPDFSAAPAGVQYGGGRDVTRGIAEFNAIIEQEAHGRGLETADVFGVSQVGRNRLDFVAGDGLHPSGAQYAAWVEVIAPVAERVLQ